MLMKDLIRSRHQIDVYRNMAGQLKAMSLQLGTIGTAAAINSAIGSVSKTLAHVNGSMNISEVSRMIKDFGKQQALMDINQEAVYMV